MFHWDWQFIVVTVIAAAALWQIVRSVRNTGGLGRCEECSCSKAQDQHEDFHEQPARQQTGELVSLGSRQR